MTDYAIRFSQARDFDRIFEIWLDGQQTSTSVAITEKDVPGLKKKLLHFFDDELSVFLVAYIGDDVIGWHAFDPVFQNPLLIGKAVQGSTYVDPKSSSGGVGTKLVKHGMLEAKRRGVAQIYLWIHVDNKAAIRAISRFDHSRVNIPAVPGALPDFYIYLISTSTLIADSDTHLPEQGKPNDGTL